MAVAYVYRDLQNCILCGSGPMICRVPLAPIPIATPNFRMPSDPALARQALEGVPLALHQCEACGHVQVGQIGNPELQYRDYIYTTSLSLGLPEHFAQYARSVVSRLGLRPGAFVLEIGSNDGTLLRAFAELGMRVLGVDPAREIAHRASANGVETVADFFSERLSQRIVAQHGRADLIIANNVIANVPEMRDFARGIKVALAPDGAFVFETQYGPDVIERVLLDTVYHEHISYFFLKPTIRFFESFGMDVIDVERIATKGGSVRITVQHAGGPRTPSNRVAEMAAEEDRKGAYAQPYFDQLSRRLAEIREALKAIVADAQSRGKTVGGYGVSVGTTALLPQFGLADKIDFLVDDDPNKASSLSGPGYDIPIVSREDLYTRNAASIIVFAWRYAEPIIAKHDRFLREGGCFIVPLPSVRVISSSEIAG